MIYILSFLNHKNNNYNYIMKIKKKVLYLYYDILFVKLNIN